MARREEPQTEARQVTRDNFHEVGRWAGATECWGLDAPIPTLFMPTAGQGVMAAGIGDTIVKTVIPAQSPVE